MMKDNLLSKDQATPSFGGEDLCGKRGNLVSGLLFARL